MGKFQRIGSVLYWVGMFGLVGPIYLAFLGFLVLTSPLWVTILLLDWIVNKVLGPGVEPDDYAIFHHGRPFFPYK